MARFNSKTSNINQTMNFAGGVAYRQSPEIELVSILLTSFLNDSFYQSGNDTYKRLKELIYTCDKMFVAQAGIFARTRFGMRTITHVLASELAMRFKGEQWAKDFFSAIVYRPDDMLEILSYHTGMKRKVTNAMKKGFAKAFDKFDGYALAKYRGDGKDFKLVDVVNIVHPVPVEKNMEALKALVSDNLRSSDTWESELTRAGQEAKNETEKSILKKNVWALLISERRIGYFALLRNLRNIIHQAPKMTHLAGVMLTDKILIRKSLVLPFRYLTAYLEIENMPINRLTLDIKEFLNKAVDISLSNVPKFEGKTLVALDTSGSMYQSNSAKSPHLIGALFATALVKTNKCDFMVFNDDATYPDGINWKDSTLNIAKSMDFAAGGTNFHSIFERAKGYYDRIIILSDMQGWIGYYSPQRSFEAYKQKFRANPFIYSFDLQNYGTMQFPENKVFAITGFSEKVFDMMKFMETERTAMVKEIKNIRF